MVDIYRVERREQHVRGPRAWRIVLLEQRDWVKMVNKGHVKKNLGGR